MSGETSSRESAWTVDTLKEMLDERYATQTKAVDAAFVAQQTAMQTALEAVRQTSDKTERAAEKRFELLNELRTGVATKEQLDALEKVVNNLTGRVDRTEGHSSGTADQANTHRLDLAQMLTLVGLLIAGIGVISAILATR